MCVRLSLFAAQTDSKKLYFSTYHSTDIIQMKSMARRQTSKITSGNLFDRHNRQPGPVGIHESWSRLMPSQTQRFLVTINDHRHPLQGRKFSTSTKGMKNS